MIYITQGHRHQEIYVWILFKWRVSRRNDRSWIKRKIQLLVEHEILWVKTTFLKVAGAVITYCET